jgi:heptaprenylglyceryl phosphate synthase
MVTAWANWDHGTRVDPDNALRDRDSYAAIADTGTDAIIVGGTTNVTEANVQPILDALASIEIPVFVERPLPKYFDDTVHRVKLETAHLHEVNYPALLAHR